MRFAVDTGGTFTDLVVQGDTGECRVFKARTTPEDPITGVLDALSLAAAADDLPLKEFLGKGTSLLHGTTHAINAIITGRTARTAFLTSQGHGDMLVLREGGRSETFNFNHNFPQPFVPKQLTHEIPERIMADGKIAIALDEDSVLSTIENLKKQDVEAVAVCLLWSIVNPTHENRVGELLEQHFPDVPFTLSSRLNPAVREFRRASSSAIDASLKPMMSRYLLDLKSRLQDAGFDGRTLVVTSQAGVIDATDAASAPIHIVNSGPSMAPIAGRHFAQCDSEAQDVIIADTGGTTYDVSIVRKGQIPTTRETWIGPPYRGIMLGFPWVDVKSVGAGGGSIAWIDAGGLLHVGPASAGAEPGPVVYGRGGTEPTVTDASVVLGYIDPEYFLGGSMELDQTGAEQAIREKIAEPLKVEVPAAADAIVAIATENMVQAILDITVKQGIDPREAVLVGGGGAAGLNSVKIARRLGCRTLIIPEVGAALSAAGALMSDLKAEYHAALATQTNQLDFSAVEGVLAELRSRCEAFAAGPGANALETKISFKVDARYATQVWEIEVPLRNDGLRDEAGLAEFVEDFHRTHEELFSFRDPASAIEIIGWSAEVACRIAESEEVRLVRTESPTLRPARQAWFQDVGWCETPVHHFEGLEPGQEVSGPAIVENAFTTIIIDPGARAKRLPSGSLSVDVGFQ